MDVWGDALMVRQSDHWRTLHSAMSTVWTLHKSNHLTWDRKGRLTWPRSTTWGYIVTILSLYLRPGTATTAIATWLCSAAG